MFDDGSGWRSAFTRNWNALQPTLMELRAVSIFVARQIAQLREGGSRVLVKKAKTAAKIALGVPVLIAAVPIVFAIRLIRPLVLFRFGYLKAARIGHFAGNTELYLCERDTGINRPDGRHADIFYLQWPVCNRQLAKMWRRHLRILPAMVLDPVVRVNRLIPGGARHEIGNNTHEDRDVHNLMDESPPHLTFSADEEKLGEAGMRAMGIAPGARFVCLVVRDSAYLEAHMPGSWSYHDYRDSDIASYVLAAEELARRGYFVVRMGAKVHKAMPSDNPKVIDYASNGARSDFMDIYLGAKCAFCVSSNTGLDLVPTIFRRPVVHVNMVPLGYINTFRRRDLTIVRHHEDLRNGQALRLDEIFGKGVAFCVDGAEYERRGVRLVANTAEEIRDAVVEMAERFDGIWKAQPDDERLQARFWSAFAAGAVRQGTPLHGEIRARISAAFLRNNRRWLD